jgi:hypothetical protein
MRGVILSFTFFCLLALAPLTGLLAQQVPINKIRDQYFGMKEVKDGALNLYFRLKPLTLEKNPVMLAYRGAASAASAGSVSGVNKKLQYFNNGKAELEQAVELAPLDLEIRFLRLATQLNAPSFLGYHGNIEEDKKLIISSLTKISLTDPNAYLYRRISGFLLTTDILKAEERKTVSLLNERFRN